MDYLEAAALLGQAILESGEYKQFKDAENALLADTKAQQIIMEHKQLQDEMVEASRNDWSKEDLERVRDTLLAKQKELNEYEATKQYLKAKQGFELMMKSVNGVIEHFLSGGDSSCSGSCSSCSGCH